jgi:hypothetical protein
MVHAARAQVLGLPMLERHALAHARNGTLYRGA